MNIPPNHLMSEAVVQAAFFHHCQLLGVNCALELSSPVGRHDCVIFDKMWSHVLAIIECKLKSGRGKSQRERYSKTGVPVHMLFHPNDAAGLIREIIAVPFVGISWFTICQMPKKQRRRKGRFSHMNLCEEMNVRE